MSAGRNRWVEYSKVNNGFKRDPNSSAAKHDGTTDWGYDPTEVPARYETFPLLTLRC